MSEISYGDCGIPVRKDLPLAHRHAWRRLAEPGTWWSGAERVCIAAEVRNARKCPLCEERKRALSTAAASGRHDSLGVLPEARART